MAKEPENVARVQAERNDSIGQEGQRAQVDPQ